MHTNSTYPCPTTELNLNYIQHLKDKFPAAEIGYSGHEYGLVTTFGAVALGATWDSLPPPSSHSSHSVLH